MRPPCGIPHQIHLREKVVAACQAQTALRQQPIPPHEVGGRFKAGVAIAPEGRAAAENAVQDPVPPGGQQIHGKARVVGEFPSQCHCCADSFQQGPRGWGVPRRGPDARPESSRES